MRKNTSTARDQTSLLGGLLLLQDFKVLCQYCVLMLCFYLQIKAVRILWKKPSQNTARRRASNLNQKNQVTNTGSNLSLMSKNFVFFCSFILIALAPKQSANKTPFTLEKMDRLWFNNAFPHGTSKIRTFSGSVKCQFWICSKVEPARLWVSLDPVLTLWLGSRLVRIRNFKQFCIKKFGSECTI